MQKEIELEIIGHLNQLKLNKQNVKIIKDKIRSESMKLFHFIMKQQIKLIKQINLSIHSCNTILFNPCLIDFKLNFH